MINVMNFNIAIKTKDLRCNDISGFFFESPKHKRWLKRNGYEVTRDEYVHYMNEGTDIYDILVWCGLFKSKGDARKNWKRGGLQDGWKLYDKVGKLNNSLAILNIHEDSQS